MKRTKHELKAKLDLQLRQLTNRCDAYYEKGEMFEAYSAATVVRVLVHDTRSSTSLLNQMGIKESTQYLDSRSRGNLYMMGIINGYSGLHPRTRFPEKQYSEKYHFGFDEWWNHQEFNIRGIPFTRRELVGALANKEGGAHVDETPHSKLNALNHSASPYSASENGESWALYGAELASMCAIGEEILFTLTPEPQNRKRMLSEAWQKPYYLSMSESDDKKEELRAIRSRLDDLLISYEEDRMKKHLIEAGISSLDNVLQIECLTSEDFEVVQSVDYLMSLAKIPWG